MAASGERTLSVWFAGKVAAAINDADGRRLEGLVRMTAGIPQPVVAPLKEALAAEEEAAPETRQVAADKWELFVEAVEDGVRTERMAIAEVVCLHVRSEVLAARNRWTEAFQAEVAAADRMVAQLDVESGTNWWLPLVNAIAAQLRFAGAKADGQADISGDAKQGRFLRQVPDMLMRFFRKMIIDRSPKEVSRTSGLLFLVNHMLAVAFKLNNHKFCESTLRSMAASTFPELETFPLSQRITFRYYEGRYFISMQKYAQACESLELVFNSSPPGKNKRLALLYLVPVKLMLGKIPKKEILLEYRLELFIPFVNAIKSASLSTFEEHMSVNSQAFVKLGILLIMERIKRIVYVMVLKKSLRANKKIDQSGKPYLLRKALLEAAMRISGETQTESDFRAIECIVAGLIADGLVKGYIANNVGVMLSKTDPFPAMNVSSS